jgi:hypothetical protein
MPTLTPGDALTVEDTPSPTSPLCTTIGAAGCGVSKQGPPGEAHPWLVAVKCLAGAATPSTSPCLLAVARTSTSTGLIDVAGALKALPELLVEALGQASLAQEVPRAETFWSLARSAARYRPTNTPGRWPPGKALPYSPRRDWTVGPSRQRRLTTSRSPPARLQKATEGVRWPEEMSNRLQQCQTAEGCVSLTEGRSCLRMDALLREGALVEQFAKSDNWALRRPACATPKTSRWSPPGSAICPLG